MYSLRDKNNKTIAENIPDIKTAILLGNGYKDCWIISGGGIVKDISSRDIEKRYIDDLILGDYEIHIGLLSINKYINPFTKLEYYQVSSGYRKHDKEHYREKIKLPFCELYDDLEKAVDRFLKMKKQCKL